MKLIATIEDYAEALNCIEAISDANHSCPESTELKDVRQLLAEFEEKQGFLF
jgi:hypothetical protein